MSYNLAELGALFSEKMSDYKIGWTDYGNGAEVDIKDEEENTFCFDVKKDPNLQSLKMQRDAMQAIVDAIEEADKE